MRFQYQRTHDWCICILFDYDYITDRYIPVNTRFKCVCYWASAAHPLLPPIPSQMNCSHQMNNMKWRFLSRNKMYAEDRSIVGKKNVTFHHALPTNKYISFEKNSLQLLHAHSRQLSVYWCESIRHTNPIFLVFFSYGEYWTYSEKKMQHSPFAFYTALFKWSMYTLQATRNKRISITMKGMKFIRQPLDQTLRIFCIPYLFWREMFFFGGWKMGEGDDDTSS